MHDLESRSGAHQVKKALQVTRGPPHAVGHCIMLLTQRIDDIRQNINILD